MNSKKQLGLASQLIELAGIEFDRKFIPYQRLATRIVNLTRTNGSCRPQDLLPLGFSEKEIEERWHMAHAMARVELRLIATRERCHG